MKPDVFVQSTVNRAAETLVLDSQKKKEWNELKKIAIETVDIRGIGFYSLGSHRKTSKDRSKKEYIKVFENYFLKSFSSRLAEYSNPIIQVDSKKKINENYTIVQALLLLQLKRPAVKIEWRIIQKIQKNH